MQIVSASPTLLLNAILATWAQFCKDCYIISTCTPSCPAPGTAWLWWLAWAGAWLCYPLMWLSIYNKEWDITVIRAGVKYVWSNTNTNTNTFFSGASNTNTNTPAKTDQIQIQIQIQLIKYKYKYKYTMRPRQNCRHFTDTCILLTYKNLLYCKKIVLNIQISLKIVSKGPIYNKPTLVQIIAWCWVGNKPLSDQWWPGLLMHKCITRPKWVNVKCSVADCYLNVV